MSGTSWGRSGSWDTMPDLAQEAAPQTRRQGGTADFVLFTVIPMAGIQISGFPVMEIASALAVVLAMTRAPRVRPALGITALLIVAMVGMMFLSAELNDLTPYRRLLHLVLFVTLMVVVSQGRFHVGGLSHGLALGLVISGAAYLGGYSSGYEGRLTGLFADPNAAGYILATLGCLALGGLTTSRLRWPVGLLILLFIVLTFSRTSMLATALILVWMLVGSRVATLFGSILLGLMFYVVSSIPLSLRNFGPFEDRSGSDALRIRIVAQEKLMIRDGPWYGNGPGTSRVDVQGETFFFHNSYLALQNEAGLVAVILLVGAGIIALLGLMRLPADSRNFWYEGALIALAVCAVNLGEVLLELPAALVLGLALFHARASRQVDREAPPNRPPVLLADRLF